MFNKLLNKALKPFKGTLPLETQAAMTSSLLLQGRIASWHVRSRERISTLQDVEFKVFSQWGEDGIIDWLVERAAIPPGSRTFVEFGVEDYREANTRFLLQNRNWRGLILDGGSAVVRATEEDSLTWKHQLSVKQAFITRENINELISSAGLSGEVGLLSIDVDGNDYWVWEAIEVIQPIVCICEYNAVFGDLHPVSVPYDAAFQRTRAHHSNLYFGASIAALRSLAAKKGYRFVGTTLAANDAFFVREDFAERFVGRSLEVIRAMPSLARESRDESGKLNFISGLDRLRQIAALPVVNTETGETIRLGDLEPAYSDEWLGMMTGVGKN